MTAGVYAALNLEGGPVDPLVLRALGAEPGAADGATGPCCLWGRETRSAGEPPSIVHSGDSQAVLVGRLYEPGRVAAALGVAADQPQALLALLAWRRYGADLALHLDGEWALLQWSAAERRLVVSLSSTCRDPVFYAETVLGVAVAPRIAILARVPGVDDSIDPCGFALHLARAQLRSRLSVETALAGVRRVPPGGTEIFGAQRRSLRCAAPALPAPWTGSFEQALAGFDGLLTRILADQMAGHGRVAGLLSGGLDSSLVAWFAKAALTGEQQLQFYNSAVPEGEGLVDESAYAGLVTERLRLLLHPVLPSPEASVYIPRRRTFDDAEAPVASPRHYLYQAFYDRALADGVSLIVDGSHGEATLTAPGPLRSWLPSPRRLARDLRRSWRQRGEVLPGFADLFHAYLHADALQDLLAQGLFARLPPVEAVHRRWPGERWGYVAAMDKNAVIPSRLRVEGLEHGYPFRDRRLLRFMAALPSAFIAQGGLNRAIGRRLLLGRLPDTVALRPKGGAFSPDFARRIAGQTQHVLDALPGWRAGEAGSWLDLALLEREMRALRQGDHLNITRQFRAQATAIAAAYFDWRSQLARGR